MFQRIQKRYLQALDGTRARIPGALMLIAAGFFLFVLVGEILGPLQ